MSTVWLPIIKVSRPNGETFYNLLKVHPEQQRPVMNWDACLASAALLRATQASKVFNHCFEGNCANRIVKIICPLPSHYPENGNSIESLIGGVEDPDKALFHLLQGKKHADHLLGRNDGFRAQSRVGIGFVQVIDSPYQYYYSVLISA